MSFKELSISLHVLESLVLSGSRAYQDDLTDQILSYSHTTQALGGFWSAQFSLASSPSIADEWISNGLGRHVELWGPAGVAWEGFVNRVTITQGGLQVVRGPLVEIGNRVELVYSTVDTTTDPPTIGARRSTDLAEDTDSQARWGIVHKVLSTGGATETTAEQMRDTWIEENALPVTTEQLNFEAGGTTIMVECLGYVHWLDLYPYNETGTTGEQNASAKILAILADNPNITPIPFSTEHVDANTVQVKAYENDNLTAWNLCKSITANGGTSNERWLFGVYKGREVWYHAAPTDTAYQHRLGDPQQWLTNMVGDWVPPWEARPGRWLEVPDFLVGRSPGIGYRDDPRKLFIEQVTYTAPLGLSVMGGKVDTLPQALAKLGLSGVGA